jgi:hypothetical protein
MNRPPRSDFMIGTRGGVILTSCLAIYVLYRWGSQDEHHEVISWVLPALALLLCKASIAARKRVGAFTQWNDAWRETAGLPPERPAAKRRHSPRQWAISGVGSWALAGWWLCAHAAEAGSPAFAASASLFALLSLWGLGTGLTFLAKRTGTRATSRSARPAREHIVAVCLPVPLTSPSARQFTAALPDYCQQLLAHSNTTPSETRDESRI